MDADRTTMMGGVQPAVLTAEEQCPACETTIPGGDEFCPKCGFQRGTWPEATLAQPAAASGSPAQSAGPELWSLSAGDQTWPLSAGKHVLGRGEVEIRIEDGYASRRHAQLEVTADTVTLTDLGSSNGTFIGDRRLDANSPEQLSNGDSFRIANTEVHLRKSYATESANEPIAEQQESAAAEGTQVMDADSQGAQHTDNEGTMIDESAQLSDDQPVQEPPEPSASHWELRRDGETVEIGTGEMTLGRKDTASRIIEGDSYVSGCHCRLIATEDMLEIIDLHSTNGTYVNEARLDPEQPWKLEMGDKVRIGQTTYEVVNNKQALTPGQEAEQAEPST